MNRPTDIPLETRATGWSASLELRFARDSARTVLADNRHQGPLRVQKTLYPEGEGICHAVIVHPPGGIAGGDRLAIDIALGSGAQAFVTTPGAAKWYKANGCAAHQVLRFTLASDATLEWLPQETIVYNDARAEMLTEVDLAAGASYIGWEILCLGRAASGEEFGSGRIRQRLSIRQDGKLLWNEAGVLTAQSGEMTSPVGWHGATVCATLVAAGRNFSNATIETLRARLADECGKEERAAVSRLPLACVARYLGDSSERAKQLLTLPWDALRPEAAGAAPHAPRIWRT